MKITTSSGKTFDIQWIWATREDNRLMIELADDKTFAELAADLDGVPVITKTDSDRPNVKEVYEGFTKLVAMSRENAEGVIRLVLKKGDEA